MQSELDRKFDAVLAAITGPGGKLIIARDEQGRAIVDNFPATLPLFFKTFCMLNGAVEAVVAGEERLTFADLDRWSDRLAQALVARGIAKGDRPRPGPDGRTKGRYRRRSTARRRRQPPRPRR